MFWYSTGHSFGHEQTAHHYAKRSELYPQMKEQSHSVSVHTDASALFFLPALDQETAPFSFKWSKCLYFVWRVLHSLFCILSRRFHSDQNSHDVFSPLTPTLIPETHLLHSTTQEKQLSYAMENIVSSSLSCFARGHESLLWAGGGSQSPRLCFIISVHLQPSYVTVSFSQCYRQSLSVLKISLTATCREQSQGKEKKHTKAKCNLERNWSQKNLWLGFFYNLKGHIFCGACRVCF